MYRVYMRDTRKEIVPTMSEDHNKIVDAWRYMIVLSDNGNQLGLHAYTRRDDLECSFMKVSYMQEMMDADAFVYCDVFDTIREAKAAIEEYREFEVCVAQELDYGLTDEEIKAAKKGGVQI